MKVKAKWAIKVNGKWHNATETFDVDSVDGIRDAVEIIEEEKPAPVRKEVKAETPETEAAPEATEEPRPKAVSRSRRKISEK